MVSPPCFSSPSNSSGFHKAETKVQRCLFLSALQCTEVIFIVAPQWFQTTCCQVMAFSAEESVYPSKPDQQNVSAMETKREDQAKPGVVDPHPKGLSLGSDCLSTGIERAACPQTPRT